MASKGLGRGFDALIPTQLVEQEFDPTASTSAESSGRSSGDSVLELDVRLLDPNPHQPRTNFDDGALEELATSIRKHGILQPVVVAEVDGGRYQLIAGERRLRAAKLAGLKTMPAIVRSFTDQQKLELALIENLQRQDLNPIETAMAYRKLSDQFNLTLETIGKRVGKDISTISNSIRLLNLPLEARRAVAAGEMTEGHGRVVLTVVNPEKQKVLTRMIIANEWSVRQAEEFARGFREADATKDTALKRIAQTNEVTNALSDYLGTKVTMRHTAKGGRLTIEYYSEEELDRIYQAITADK